MVLPCGELWITMWITRRKTDGDAHKVCFWALLGVPKGMRQVFHQTEKTTEREVYSPVRLRVEYGVRRRYIDKNCHWTKI